MPQCFVVFFSNQHKKSGENIKKHANDCGRVKGFEVKMLKCQDLWIQNVPNNNQVPPLWSFIIKFHSITVSVCCENLLHRHNLEHERKPMQNI